MAFLNLYFCFGLGTSLALFLPLCFVFSGFLEGSKKNTELKTQRSHPLLHHSGSVCPKTTELCAHNPGPECVWGKKKLVRGLKMN